MAAVAQPELVTIQINDIEIQVPKGELIVESVKRLGLEIPIFCYHPRMKPVGMCRMCLVEVGFKGPDGTVKKMPKPQAGCTLPASEGMAIFTDTELVHKDRKGVLELLLINHPLDCPICDRGGECPLQNNTLFYGPSTSRFVELKRHLPKAFPLSKYVTLDLERCIQCGRCVRFTEEISGDAQLAFRFRGASMQPSTFELTNFESKFSGNVIEICPVGALTNAKYRFRARPWDLETRPAICTECSNGCSIWFDYRVGNMVRINGRTNESVNEEWTCDRGKFGHEYYNSTKRLTKPLVRRGDALVQSSWPEAYDEIRRAFEGQEVALVGGGKNSNEDLYLGQHVFRTIFKSDNIDHRFQRFLPNRVQTARLNLRQERLTELEHAPTIVVFGSSLADEEPILFLRLRKAWFQNNARIIVVHDRPTDADSFADATLRYTGSILEAAKSLKSGDVGGSGFDSDELSRVKQLIGSGDVPIITTAAIYNSLGAQEALEVLSGTGSLSLYGLNANDQGAEDIGFRPNGGKNTDEILQVCADGQIQALWVLGCDPFISHLDKGLVQRAVENVPFLVYQGHSECEIANFASVVLPMAAPAEMDGTYTNLERRVQRMDAILQPKGEGKPAWRVFSELALRVAGERPLFNPSEVIARMKSDLPHFSDVDWDRLKGSEGIILTSVKEPVSV